MAVSPWSAYFRTKHRRKRESELCRLMTLGHSVISMNQCLIRRSLFKQTGLFDVTIGGYADLLWQLRALRHTDFLYHPVPYAGWRVHGEQITSQDRGVWALNLYKCRLLFSIGCQGYELGLSERRSIALSFIRALLNREYDCLRLLGVGSAFHLMCLVGRAIWVFLFLMLRCRRIDRKEFLVRLLGVDELLHEGLELYS